MIRYALSGKAYKQTPAGTDLIFRLYQCDTCNWLWNVQLLRKNTRTNLTVLEKKEKEKKRQQQSSSGRKLPIVSSQHKRKPG